MEKILVRFKEFNTIDYILKKFGYYHSSEITKILNDYADEIEKVPPYNPYKKGSTAWWQQQYQNLHTANEIRFLKIKF